MPGAGDRAADRFPSTTEGTQPPTDRPGNEVAGRRRLAVAAGHAGDAAGRDHALALLHDDEPVVRAAALGALARMGDLDQKALRVAMADTDTGVRRRACEEAGRLLGRGAGDAAAKVSLLVDRLGDDPAVAEAAAWGLGEAGAEAASAWVALADLARRGPPPCREAAVAALGAIGHPGGLDAVLAALEDRPAVRRRATVALAGFDDERAEEGLRRAAADRDWQVRQAAEELLGGD